MTEGVLDVLQSCSQPQRLGGVGVPEAVAATELRARADAGDWGAQQGLVDLLVGQGDADAVAELQQCVHAAYASAADALITLYRSSGATSLGLDANANARYHPPSQSIS